MNCIDAVEGVVKDIIRNVHQAYLTEGMEDTEYIRNVKTIIEGADRFIHDNKELVSDPDLLGKVLREFARELWLESGRTPPAEEEAEEEGKDSPFDADYYTYCFDHIYNHGIYPP